MSESPTGPFDVLLFPFAVWRNRRLHRRQLHDVNAAMREAERRETGGRR